MVWQASVSDLGDGVFRLRVRIDNGTQVEPPCPSRDEALGQALLSCHLLLGVEGGFFLSSMDPLVEHRECSASCRNVGVWPVLAGDPAAPAFMIASPIILYDFPQIAPQSPGELFDATEIDEMLRLRVLTLTDQEKQEASSSDPRGRQVIERLDGLGESEAMTLRGVWKGGPRPGDRVRLKPSRRADALDHTLAGHAATVVSLDVDLEGMQHIGVVLDEDPGRDLGLAGWPGHPFYFAVEEVEPL